MGKVLIEKSDVRCGAAKSVHQGKVPTTGVAKLTVMGSGVLTAASLPGPSASISFIGCTNAGSPPAGGPCTGVIIAKGTATRLKVDGQFVVLDSLDATTNRASKVTVESVNNDLLNAD